MKLRPSQIKQGENDDIFNLLSFANYTLSQYTTCECVRRERGGEDSVSSVF